MTEESQVEGEESAVGGGSSGVQRTAPRSPALKATPKTVARRARPRDSRVAADYISRAQPRHGHRGALAAARGVKGGSAARFVSRKAPAPWLLRAHAVCAVDAAITCDAETTRDAANAKVNQDSITAASQYHRSLGTTAVISSPSP